MFFASIGMAEVVHRRTHGHHPWGNIGVDYASPLLTPAEQTAFNAEVYRVAADADAVRYMRRFFEPRGRTRSKVITVHALDDGLVLPENEDKYREAFEAAGTSDRLVQLFTATGGHCIFLAAWTPALQALTAWVEEGRKPSTTSVSPTCGNCLTDQTPGPWASRWWSGARRARRCARWCAARSPGTARRARPASRRSTTAADAGGSLLPRQPAVRPARTRANDGFRSLLRSSRRARDTTGHWGRRIGNDREA